MSGAVPQFHISDVSSSRKTRPHPSQTVPNVLKQTTLLSILVVAATLAATCSSPEPEVADSPQVDASQNQMPPQMAAAGLKAGTVKEKMDAAGYTYLHVDTGDETFWAAAPSTDVEVGDDVIVPAGMPMQNFHSSALDRDFDVVYFVEGVQVGGMSGEPIQSEGADLPSGHPPVAAPQEAAPAMADAEPVEPLSGGRQIGDIIANAGELSGQTVSFRGRVVKFNSGIMGKNWLHVQDGTGEAGENDLTVTTNDVANVGESVVVTGTVATDRDFGFGYAYDVMVEDAKVIIE